MPKPQRLRDRPKLVINLVDVGPADTADSRLKRALKALLRTYQFVNIGVVDLPPEAPPATTFPPTRPLPGTVPGPDASDLN